MTLPDCPPLYTCSWRQDPPKPPDFQWDPVVLFTILGVAFVVACLSIAIVEVFERRQRIAEANASRAAQERYKVEAERDRDRPPRIRPPR